MWREVGLPFMIFWMPRIGARDEPSAMFNALEGANIFGAAVVREIGVHNWLQLWMFEIHAPKCNDLVRENM